MGPARSTRWTSPRRAAAALALVAVLGAACADDGDDPGVEGAAAGVPDDAATAPWEVRGGVETLTVVGAEPGEHLTLVGDDGPLLTLIADDLGQAHFAYLPAEHLTLQSGPEADLPEVAGGRAVPAGAYEVVAAEADPPLTSGPIVVLGRDDHPDVSLYEEQILPVAVLDVLGGSVDGSTAEDGFGYIEMRDGVQLSATIRMPDPSLYGEGPYPTVIEYSGYGPSNPAAEEPGVADRPARSATPPSA